MALRYSGAVTVTNTGIDQSRKFPHSPPHVYSLIRGLSSYRSTSLLHVLSPRCCGSVCVCASSHTRACVCCVMLCMLCLVVRPCPCPSLHAPAHRSVLRSGSAQPSQPGPGSVRPARCPTTTTTLFVFGLCTFLMLS